jgi:hypothetical protein
LVSIAHFVRRYDANVIVVKHKSRQFHPPKILNLAYTLPTLDCSFRKKANSATANSGGNLSQFDKTVAQVSSRRRQLLLAAPTTAALTALPQISFASSAARVGLLMPKTESIAGSKADWLRGFETELRSARQTSAGSVSLTTAQYAPGPYRAAAAARSMLANGCNVLTGLFSCEFADRMPEEYWAKGAKFLIADLGAKARRRVDTLGVQRVGPNLWKHAYALGQYQASRGARRALVASSFYESGFDLVAAYREGFLDAGGERIDVVVTGTPELAHGEFAWSRISVSVAAQRPDAMFALYSGSEASKFLQFVERAALREKFREPIAALSTMIDSLPRDNTNRSDRLPLTIARATLGDSPKAEQSIFAETGRAAAIEMLRASASGSTVPAADWSLFVETGSLSELASRSLRIDSKTVAWCDENRLGSQLANSGWFVPYGA